ncbi:unnamed protein product, partial [Adineta steineri]
RNMIHIHVDDIHPIDIDIYVNISTKSFTNSTPKKDILSPILANDYHPSREESVYECLFDKDISSNQKKIYTLQQVLDNVESIQKQYEQIIENSITTPSSCFISLKHLTKVFKNFKFLRNKSIEQPRKINQIIDKSPFIFGGETLQWIALPQYHDHIYENAFIN